MALRHPCDDGYADELYVVDAENGVDGVFQERLVLPLTLRRSLDARQHAHEDL